MDELLKHNDLKEAYFFLYKDMSHIKLNISDIGEYDDGVIVYLEGDMQLTIWNDTEVIPKVKRDDEASEFEWCYQIKNSDGILCYIAKK